MTALFLAILVLSLLLLAYYRIPLLISIAILAGLTFAFTELRHFYEIPGWFRWSFGIITVSLAGFAIKPLRRLLISNRLFSIYRKVMPKLSTTEREALEAGTVWWDAELFSGKPRWRRLLRHPKPSLNEAEQAFINGPVEELCLMLNDWEISHELNDLPEPVWQFIRSNGFFGMIIPKEYGGLEFSAQGNSAVVMKLASANLTAAVTVMVPNSLGPGDLLMHYGTDEQRDYFLPRLASGEQIGDDFPSSHEVLAYSNQDENGLRLVTGGDTEALIWNLDVDSWVDLACRTAASNLTVAESLIVLVGYNVLYALPFAAVPVLVATVGGSSRPLLQRINHGLDRVSSYLMPVLLSLVGVALVTDAISYFATGSGLF